MTSSSKLTLGRILQRSLRHRSARSFSALVALTVSAGVATALLTLYADLDNKLHREFRSFGANVVITAAAGASLPADSLAMVKQAAGEDALAAVFSYAVATTDRGTPVVVAGTDFAAVKRLDAWWAVDAWPDATDERAALLGQRAANFVGDEHQVKLTFAGKTVVLRGAGRLKTGGDEDSRIYMPMAAFDALTGGSGGTSVIEVQVPGGAAKVEAAIARLEQKQNGCGQGNNEQMRGERLIPFGNDKGEKQIPFGNDKQNGAGSDKQNGAGIDKEEKQIPFGNDKPGKQIPFGNDKQENKQKKQVSAGNDKQEGAICSGLARNGAMQVRPVRQLVEGESRIVDRTHALMYAAVLLIALTVSVSVLSTLSASVFERRRDFALMMALGGSYVHLLALFLLEAVLIGLAGVVAGFVLGSASAWGISEGNFGTATLPRVQVLPLVLLLNMAIAVLAAVLPARSLRALQPAALLKGE